jgi:hypothetical protein
MLTNPIYLMPRARTLRILLPNKYTTSLKFHFADVSFEPSHSFLRHSTLLGQLQSAYSRPPSFTFTHRGFLYSRNNYWGYPPSSRCNSITYSRSHLRSNTQGASSMSPRTSLNRYIDITRYGTYLDRTYKLLNCHLRVFSLHAKDNSTDKNYVSAVESGGVGWGNENG